MQAHYQAVYVIYASNPCNKESQEECEKAMKEIRDRTFILSKLETKTKNISSSRATAKVKGAHGCPVCGAAASAKKTWTMAGRPDKSGARKQLRIGLYKCQKGHKFRQVWKGGIIPGRIGETNALLSKRISEVEKLVSRLKK